MPSRSATSPIDAVKFRRLLLRWFQKYQRKLPWRGESDAYRILVSEIMLQQTRVAVVEDRYKKFVQQFPAAEKLARAQEATVLAAWSGLGYYRRARALHRAAKEIARKKEFPRTSLELMELPGVGRYTAAAVASIAFGEPVAVVDGNVKRVLCRITGRDLKEEEYWLEANRLLDSTQPGNFNQAVMELGALVCLPAQPACLLCPVSSLCVARGPMAKAQRETRRKGVLQYALLRRNGSILLQQREQESSLMPGMWELPSLEASEHDRGQPTFKLKHSITTTDYTVLVYIVSPEGAQSGQWVALRSIHRLPLTGLTRKIVARLKDA